MPLGPPNLGPTAAQFSTPVTRLRFAEPTVTAEGLPADAAPTETPGRAHHWPASGETLERLEEGVERSDVREGTTSLDLRVVEDGPSGDVEITRSDGLRDDVTGVEYTVVSVAPRRVGAAGTVTWRGFVMVRRA